MRGRDIKRTTRWLTVMVAAVGALTIALSAPGLALGQPLPAAPTASTPASPTPTAAQPSLTANASLERITGVLIASGRLTNASGQAVSGAQIKISYDGKLLTTAVTDVTGSFLVQVPVPAGKVDGVHLVSFLFAGGPGLNGVLLEVPVGVGAVSAVLTATLEPTPIAPGEVLGVSGTLRDTSGVPIPGARIEIVLSLGGSAMAATENDGSWSVNIGLAPAARGAAIPSSSRVTVTFAGDSIYPGTEINLTLPMLAAKATPTPTPTPTPSKGSSTATGAAAAAAAGGTGSTTAPKAESTVANWIWTSTGLVLLAIVLVLLAAFAVFFGPVVLTKRRAALVPGESSNVDLLAPPATP